MAGSRDLEKVTRVAGRDLRLDYTFGGGFFEDADLAVSEQSTRVVLTRDLAVADGLDALRQAFVNRLKTRKGELAPLGHPEYGSRHHELIGQPNVQRTRDLIKLYVLQALRDEHRIERVLEANVRADHSPPRDVVSIELRLLIHREVQPLNLIIPFSLETPL
jgi:phage baseplate assembly protein W